MKTIILAGGLGTRLSEETQVKPKPMVEIGGKPILWHIMKIYAQHDYREFITALGYKSEVIKRFFVDFYNLQNNLTIHTGNGKVDVHGGNTDDWTIDLVDTGKDTNTGGRLKRLASWLGN